MEKTYYRIVYEFRADDDAIAINRFRSALARPPLGIDQIRLDKIDQEHGSVWVNIREEIINMDA